MVLLMKSICLLLLTGFVSLSVFADTFVRDAGGNVIYQYSNGVMYEGLASKGKVLFRYSRRSIYPGRKNSGMPLATWKDNALYPENLLGGYPWYVFKDKGGHPRSAGAMAVVFIDGKKVYKGNGPGGKLLFQMDDPPLPTPVVLYLFHKYHGGAEASKKSQGALRIDINKVPFGYFLGTKDGPHVATVVGNTIFYGSNTDRKVAYTRVGTQFFKGANTSGVPAFSLTRNGWLYRGNKTTPENLVMKLGWFNCYAPDKNEWGKDAIGTLNYVGTVVLTEGYTKPSSRPDMKGKKPLLTSSLSNNNVPLEMRIFLIYLTQLDPDFLKTVGVKR